MENKYALSNQGERIEVPSAIGIMQELKSFFITIYTYDQTITTKGLNFIEKMDGSENITT